MLLLAVVTAVGVFQRPVLVINGVIGPLPDTAAHEVVVFIEMLPVLLERAGTHAHCVSIFAQEERAILIEFTVPCALTDFFNIVLMSVHFRGDIIGVSRRSDNALIVDRYFRADLMQKIVAFVLTCPSLSLVAERPHYNARMAAVTVIHTADPVKIAGCPFFIVAYEFRIIVRLTADAMCLDIRFVHNINSVYITQGYKVRVGRIV